MGCRAAAATTALYDLHAYAVRVAGTVGAMMSLIMQVRDPYAIARACDLGVAMQLTNIARDVGEDARNGRLYFRAAGLPTQAWMPMPSWRVRSMLRNCAAMISAPARRSRQALRPRLAGIAMLPAGCRPSIHAARLLYAEIGREVERAAHDSVGRGPSSRPGASRCCMCSALVASIARRNASDAPVLEEARFLVDAVAAAPKPEGRPRSFDERAQWLADLFTRLEKQGP